MPIQSVNPTTGKVTAEFTPLTDQEALDKLALAHDAFKQWRKTDLTERAKHLRNIAQTLRETLEESAELLTQEMGKPITQARAEVEKCATNFDYYAEHGAKFLAPRQITTDASESFVVYEPLGVILTVMPWNYAFWQVLRQVAPLLMAGNTVVLKHASNVPQAALKIEEIIMKSGAPKHIFQTLLIGSSQVESVVAHEHVKGVSLTGSEHAGSLVGAQAGAEIKPIVLELGGSDPSIVLDDADLDLTCESVAQSRLLNNGQSCIGSKRFIVHENVYDKFMEKLVGVFENYVVGDPMDEKTTLGPVVSQDSMEEVLDQIKRSVDAGATITTGGKRRGETGFFIEPTILENVSENVPSYQEEIFGPVASVIKVKDDAEAVRVANATRFGLGASIYTADITRAKSLIADIESGCVFINTFVKSDPRLPFGGVKKSGVGRELGEEGIKAFVNTKTVYIK